MFLLKKNGIFQGLIPCKSEDQKKTLANEGLKIFKTFYKALTVLGTNIQQYSNNSPNKPFFY